jgi:hypothetical protein
MRLLTIILVLFSFSVQAQFTGIGNKKFRRLTDFSMPTRNFGADTVKAISIIDTSRSSGLILISKDSTAMYTYADTMNMYTTAKAWKFTPSLPCCVPDTIDLNFITTQCTTVTSNRWRPVITDSLGRASTTACDTISYLYVDSLVSDYINANGGSYEIAYFDSLGKLTSSGEIYNLPTEFGIIKTDSSSNARTEFLITNGTLSLSTLSLNTTDQSNLGATPYSFSFGVNSQNNTTNRFSIDTLTATLTVNYDGYQNSIVIDSTINFQSSDNVNIYTYSFPILNGDVGQSLTVVSNDGLGNSILDWGNQILTDTATLNFGSIGAHAYEDLTLTVTGATDGDVVSIGIPNSAAVADASYFAWVSASNTVTIRCFNINGGTVNPPSALFKVKVFKD